MSEESDEFSDAHSSVDDKQNLSFLPQGSNLFITNNMSDVFSIEGPTGSITGSDSETEGEEDFFDVIEPIQDEKVPERETVNNVEETQKVQPSHNEFTSRRKQNGLTILEFLEEEEEDEEFEGEESREFQDENKRETIYEFLASKSDENIIESSESSLSRLQSELKHEETTDRRTILNLPSSKDPTFPRRRESLLKRANPLASFFVDSNNTNNNASDSDSMISELTEALTSRTDISETRLSRAPSTLIQQFDYLKLAKRYKPVPVKVKSKQKGEFSSLLLIQELNRNQRIGNDSPTDVTNLSKAIFVLKFSPDGQFLAAAGAEGVIKIWSLLKMDPDATTSPRLAAIFDSEPVQMHTGHTAEILDCAWSTNNFLLSASMDKTVRLWHHSRSDALGIFQHLDYVTSVAFHPRDPRIFLSGSLDCKLRLWSIQDRSILHWNELPPGNYITAVAFTRSGLTAIAGTSGGTALIFDTDRLRYNTQILVRSSRSKSVGKKITSIEAVPGNYDQDERIVISSNDSRIRMYSLRDKNVLYKYKGHENVSSQIGASLSTDADFILSGSEDCRVYLWRTDGKFQKKTFFDSFRKDHIKSFESFKAHSNPVTAAIFAPNCLTNLLQSLQLRPINPLQSTEGKIIVTADVTGQIKVFENNSKLIEWLK